MAAAMSGFGAILPCVLLVQSAAGESASAAAATVARLNVDASAIPQWKVSMTLNPTKLIPPQNSAVQVPFEVISDGGYGYTGTYNDGVRVGYGGGDHGGVTGAIYAPGIGGGDYGGVSMLSQAPATTQAPYSSTGAQDAQACPLVKLPEYMAMPSVQASSSGSKGTWTTGNRIVVARWLQNFWGRWWQTIYVKTVDDNLAVKASPRTEQELIDLYGWKSNAKNYPNVTALDARHQITTGSADMGTASTTTFALTDCQDNLLFVVHLMTGNPGTVDIYDRNGGLVAHSISDPLILRHQFVDTSGYLLAIAESPGIMMNVSRPFAPTPGSKMDTAPYAILFSSGGYAGASRLLETEFHWVIATAVQVRAMVDAYGTWKPDLSGATLVYVVFLVVLWLLLIGGTLVCFYRLVYPDSVAPMRRKNPFIYPATGAPLQKLYT